MFPGHRRMRHWDDILQRHEAASRVDGVVALVHLAHDATKRTTISGTATSTQRASCIGSSSGSTWTCSHTPQTSSHTDAAHERLVSNRSHRLDTRDGNVGRFVTPAKKWTRRGSSNIESNQTLRIRNVVSHHSQGCTFSSTRSSDCVKRVAEMSLTSTFVREQLEISCPCEWIRWEDETRSPLSRQRRSLRRSRLPVTQQQTFLRPHFESKRSHHACQYHLCIPHRASRRCSPAAPCANSSGFSADR